MWRFPEIGVPPNHPYFSGIFQLLGTAMTNWTSPEYVIQWIHMDSLSSAAALQAEMGEGLMMVSYGYSGAGKTTTLRLGRLGPGKVQDLPQKCPLVIHPNIGLDTL